MHSYNYINCATSSLKENLKYISESGFEIIHMSQNANGTWFIVYDITPKR